MEGKYESKACQCGSGKPVHECCGKQKCSCGSGMPKSQCCQGQQDYLGMMMCLVKSAKMELIKEKVKKKLEATQGEKLDKVADLLVEAMTEKMKLKMGMLKKKEDMEEKFKAIFMEE